MIPTNKAPQGAYDTLIKNARVFNNGESARTEDIAIIDGKIAARGQGLEPSGTTEVIDATGLWAMPGLFDIHTHYDLELELAPGLPESVRHGTTTVVVGNCSLGLAFGSQRKDGAEPIVDCYARVENMPKSVLKSSADLATWDTPKGYIEHLETLPIGPNVVAMLPHSMLRIEAMGFEGSITRDPTQQELDKMRDILAQSLNEGYVGLSTDALPFHFLSNQPNVHKRIPTQFADYNELRILADVMRARGALWMATPPKDTIIGTMKTFLLSSGLFHKRALKTTVVAAMDMCNNWTLAPLAILFSRVVNSRFVKGDIHFQALGAPFKTFGEGPITPLFEEIPELRKMNEPDLEDREGRLKILNDPEYVKSFRKRWLASKRGFGIARLKRILSLEDDSFTFDLNDMEVVRSPIEAWIGMSLQQVFERVAQTIEGKPSVFVNQAEIKAVLADFSRVKDEADFMLQIFRSFDLDLCWSITTANRNPKTTRKLLMHPLLIPGFNDSGAHLTNLAFYDVNLRSLQAAAMGGEADLSYMIKRLTVDAAKLFNVEGGTISVGDQADLILVDPTVLETYDGDNSIVRHYREEFQVHQLINRSDGVVPLVLINGHKAWTGAQFGADFGTKRFGAVLKPDYS